VDTFAYVINLESWSAAAASAMVGHFFRIILATVFVAILAYFVLRLVGARGRASQWSRNGNLKLIETIAIGAQSMVQLIKVGDKFLVIGVSKDKGITLLAELSKDEVEEPEAVDVPPINVPFNKIMQRFLPQAKDGQREEDSDE